jgi:transposase
MIEIYTYRQIADIFGVKIKTVRNWHWAGKFKILGYRKLKGWKREAVVNGEEVKVLMEKIFLSPDSKLKNRQ